MTARTHDAFAFASLITVAAFYPPQTLNLATLIACILGTDIGALTPDLDGGGNRLWHLLPAGEKTGRILRRLFYKHRTLTHSLVGAFLIYKFFEWLLLRFLNPQVLDPNLILASIMIGYLSHLLSDSFTEEGIPLLFPINLSLGFPPIRSWRMKTGKWFEKFIVYPSIWIYLVWFIHAKKEVLISVLRLVRS